MPFLVPVLAVAAVQPTLEQLAVLVAPDGNGFEIVAYASSSDEIWATRSGEPRLSRIDVSDVRAPRLVGDILLDRFGREVTSVAAFGDVVAATILPHDPSHRGTLAIMNTAGQVLWAEPVGFHPDMVCFADDGNMVLVANEGEPFAQQNPPGSLTVIRLHNGSPAGRADVFFGDENSDASAVLWTTPLAQTPPSMIEPEYIAVDPVEHVAFVSCQENNGIALVDLAVWPPLLIREIDLGVRMASEVGLFDVHDDGVLRLDPSPAAALPQPDGIAVVRLDSRLYVLTADEGDPRDSWGADAAVVREGLEQTDHVASTGEPIVFGSRSVSAWTPDGTLAAFVSSPVAGWLASAPSPVHEARLDRRSDRRGEEPEGIAAFERYERVFAVVGFERTGAVGLFEFTGSEVRTLDMEFLAESAVGSPSPEGVVVLQRGDANPVVVVADESGGTLTLLEIAFADAASARSGDRGDPE